MSHSKRFKSIKAEVAKDIVSVAQALATLKKNPVKFDAAVEVHFRLGIDPKKGDQNVRASAVLPHGTGKVVKVAAFVSPDKEAEARSAGADVVGGEELIAEIAKTGKADFDVAVATPDMMKQLAPIAKVLGQKGLMPNPKTGTVAPDVKRMVEELKKGKVNFKNDDGANLHQVIGKLSFTDAQLEENYKTLIDSVQKAKPETVKSSLIRAIYLTTSMGPSIRVQ
jgi:large subunit ribosomal protein L1